MSVMRNLPVSPNPEICSMVDLAIEMQTAARGLGEEIDTELLDTLADSCVDGNATLQIAGKSITELIQDESGQIEERKSEFDDKDPRILSVCGKWVGFIVLRETVSFTERPDVVVQKPTLAVRLQSLFDQDKSYCFPVDSLMRIFDVDDELSDEKLAQDIWGLFDEPNLDLGRLSELVRGVPRDELKIMLYVALINSLYQRGSIDEITTKYYSVLRRDSDKNLVFTSPSITNDTSGKTMLGITMEPRTTEDGVTLHSRPTLYLNVVFGALIYRLFLDPGTFGWTISRPED